MEPTIPSPYALKLELDAGLVPVLARLSSDERLIVLSAIDLAFSSRKAALACLTTVNMALSRCIEKGTSPDPALCDILVARTGTILKLLQQ